MDRHPDDKSAVGAPGFGDGAQANNASASGFVLLADRQQQMQQQQPQPPAKAAQQAPAPSHRILELSTPRRPPSLPPPPWSRPKKRPASAERPPPLTVAVAEAAGLVPARPQPPAKPRTSVLASSTLRRMRVFCPGNRSSSADPTLLQRTGGVGLATDELERCDSLAPLRSESEYMWSHIDTQAFAAPRCEVLPSCRLSSPVKGPKPAGGTPLATPTSSKPPANSAPKPKRLEVWSDYTAPTDSWSARMPSKSQLESRRQNRHKIVGANRITPLEALRAQFKGKSLLEERWIGNLDDPENDTEMSVSAVLALLDRTQIYHHDTDLTREDVRKFIADMLDGKEVFAIARMAGRRSTHISAMQFQAIIHWIAYHKKIGFSECLSKLVHHPGAVRTTLEHYFAMFAHGTAVGFMTIYEFTRFCKTYGLFAEKPARFVEGDVYFLFLNGDEGKAVDITGFKRLLNQVAERLEMTMQDLLHLLAQREEERVAQCDSCLREVLHKVNATS
eukprot:gb/GFBE01048574.1/.p1 GENE.gb/GFBE01048574.1/~~gb/GFBE01048574.1/.p1  ORF type:complete len:504 (+),score=91.37 gb/GFBE01048574.1/:1-1512(+)